jgi:hypothetical protein
MLDACVIEQGGEENEREGVARMYVAHYLLEIRFLDTLEGQQVQNLRKPIVLDRQGRHLRQRPADVCQQDYGPDPLGQGGRVDASGTRRQEHSGSRPEVQRTGPVGTTAGSVRSRSILAAQDGGGHQ